jgi:hypothetical protein
MHPLEIMIQGEHGYLFEGACPRTYTFVPEDCVEIHEDGLFAIDCLCYIQKRWGTRNMAFNSEGSGSQLFPNERKPVTNVEAPGLDNFLERLRHGYGSDLLVQGTALH